MKKLTLKAARENIPKATAFIDEQLEALDCPMKAQMQLDVAVDELFANISLYAYPGGEGTGEAEIGFAFDETAREISITFKDRGIPFNPLKSEEPDVTLSAEKRKIGGLGIFVVKKTMDSMDYRYEDGCNILTVKKHI